MKKNMITSVLILLFAGCTSLLAQDRQEEYLGLPGDNLNLYAVMKLFQESETIEGFERNLNDENSRINNLDLNGDGFVDYIRVIDNVDRNAHYIVLQVAVSARENQDVAVFTVLQESNGQVQIQLIGDEALYGRNYIIEPIFDETPNPGYSGNAHTVNGQNVIINRTTTVEIAAWPLIRFMFLPTYVVWHSPWYYNYYPNYWHSWNPYYWDYYYGYHYNDYSYYYGNYRHWNEYRYPNYHSYYYSGRRSSSPYVSTRIHEGYYKTTYSHPEQRREGTALYNKTHSDQNNRSSGNSSVGTSGRRTSTQSGTSRQSTSNGSERKSTSSGTNRTSTTTETNRRSTTTGTDKSGSRTQSEQRATETRTNKQSKSSGVSNSGRRTSGGNQSGNSGKSTEKSKETNTTERSGRR
jgi:hypothetical protein